MLKVIRKTLLVAPLGAALAGCMATAPEHLVETPPAVTERVLQDVRYQLRAPEAAQFRSVQTFAAESDQWLTVCGYVNGENAYGGKTGFQPFRAHVKPSGTLHAVYIDDYIALGAPCFK